MKTAGKTFESEIGHSLKALSKSIDLSYRNSNLPMPMCDHMVWYAGQAYLLEEKEVHSDTLSFRAITPEERKNMNAIIHAGCEGWVLIKWIGGNTSRCFAISWQDWLELEENLGFDPDAKRNKPGSASFALVPDSARPGAFIELARVDRKDPDGHSLGRHWDLSRLFTVGSVVRLRVKLRDVHRLAEQALDDVRTASGYDDGFEMGESCIAELLSEPEC